MRPLCCKCLHSSVLCVGDLCGSCWQVECDALAVAQAREQVLRDALKACRTSNAADFTWWRPYRDIVDAALATPTDDSALREFGLKVGHAIYDTDMPAPPEAVVDDLLRGES